MQGGGLVNGPPVLPCAGGYYDQPAALLDAFALFDKWLNERKAADAG
ncbi:MAG: hypothetical protein AB7G24_00780 [Novosphingobium sp.]